jgi:hypothetical protein
MYEGIENFYEKIIRLHHDLMCYIQKMEIYLNYIWLE